MTRSVPDVPPAVQERSKRTLERIHRAGTEVLEKQGPSAVTIANVAAAAGVSTGSVYRRFGSKEQLLTAIQHGLVEEFKAEMASRLNGEHLPPDAPLNDVVRVAVQGFARTFETHQRLMRELMLVATETPGVFEVGSRGAIECGDMFRELLLGVADKITRPHPEQAIDYAYRMLYAMCAFRAIFGENAESTRPAPWPALIEEITAALCAYFVVEL